VTFLIWIFLLVDVEVLFWYEPKKYEMMQSRAMKE